MGVNGNTISNVMNSRIVVLFIRMVSRTWRKASRNWFSLIQYALMFPIPRTNQFYTIWLQNIRFIIVIPVNVEVTVGGTNTCKKGFPQPLSDTTYCSPNSLRYIYRRTKDEDRWVVPYHPETLLIWNGHINFQYITTTGFARYITKYVTKPEASELHLPTKSIDSLDDRHK